MNMKGKHILVTSGGTREYIDDVRVLTNISTGSLGAKIAEELYRKGAKVHYVHSKDARMPLLEEGISEGTFNAYPVRTCADMLDTLKALIPAFKMDAVIHSAAVSDFTFKKNENIKLSSEDEAGFIEYMQRTIAKNPKIIKYIKDWRPETILIGFKFTVGKNINELIDIAKESGAANRCDAVFANDKVMMSKYSNHVGYLINCNPNIFYYDTRICVGKDKIASEVCNYLNYVYPV